MANAENRLTGNYYIAWLSRCDGAWRRLLADRGPYVSQHQLKKEHHDACQTIAKDLLWSQVRNKRQHKKFGIGTNPRRRTNMSRYKKSATLKSLERKQKLRGLSVYRQAGVWRVLRYLPGGQILDSSFLSSTAKNKAAAIREALKMKPHRNPRRNRSHAPKHARRYKLAQRRGRLGFLRRLKGRVNPFHRSAAAAYERLDPRKPFSAGWYAKHYPVQAVSETERRLHNERVLAEMRRRRVKSNKRRRR